MKLRGPGSVRGILTLGLAALGISAVAAAPGSAQRFSLQLNAGAAVGNYSETAAGLELVPGPSLGVLAELRLTEATGLSAYAGFTRSTFTCEEGFCAGQPTDLTSQGLVAGVRWAPGRFWGRAGVAFAGLDISPEGGTSASTDQGVGFDVAAGLEFELSGSLRLRPGVVYRRHAASLDGDDGTLALLAAEVGLAFTF